MPWTVADVEQHKAGLDVKGKQQWVEVANSALAKCKSDGGKDCDAHAIRQANAVTGKQQESAQPSPLADLLTEAGRVLSSRNEKRLRAAIDELNAALAELTPPEAAAVGVETGPASESLHELTEDGAEFLRESAAPGKPPLLKLIAPGWGESGYYSPDVLRRDGPGAFPKGTLNLWNHLTEAEKATRPEGHIDSVASVLLEDARYLEDGPKGPGLYAPAKVFSDYAAKVAEKGPHIGVSINALGSRKHGRALDRDGLIVERLMPHGQNTVDFVTRAGAGGEVILQESAKPQPATTSGTASAVTASEPIEEAVSMPMDDREAEVLRESVANLTAKFNELATKHGEIQTENTQLRQHLNLREAKDVAIAKLKTVSGLPELLHDRIAEAVSTNPPLKDGLVNREAIEVLAEAGARKEMQLLSRLGYAGGQVRGLGGGPADEPDPQKLKESIGKSLRGLGLSEKAAAIGAEGRV